MESKGYLTRNDKILFVVALVVLLPLATIGFPFFALGAVALIFGGMLFWTLRGLYELLFKKRPETPVSPRALRLTRFLSRPQRIRHGYSQGEAESKLPED